MKRPAFLAVAGAAVALGLGASAQAADLVGVYPVTDKILCLHFDEGAFDYYSPAEGTVSDNRFDYSLLDKAAADNPASYTIRSAGDADYAAGRTPASVGRKTNGSEFHSPPEWWWDHLNGEPTHISEHWMYLELPAAMEVGERYTIAVGDLAVNVDEWEFTFDPSAEWSPTIHVTQLGFEPAGPKYAYLSQWMGDFDNGPHQDGGLNLDDYAGETFRVVDDETGAVVHTGTVALRQRKSETDTNTTSFGPQRNFTFADVWECDFSGFDTPGRYRVVVDRLGTSYPFRIEGDVYREAFHAAMRGLFLQRSGIIQEVEPGLEYPRDHVPGTAGVTMFYDPGYEYWALDGRPHNLDGFDFATNPVPSGIWGWYHDAGDWDTYIQAHSRVPLYLMHLYRLKPENFVDGEVGNRYRLVEGGPWIEEGGNGVPDLIDEARWYVDFLRRTRDTLVSLGYGTGGLPDYVGRDAGANIGSWQDTRALGVTAESPAGTYAAAATFAALSMTLDLMVDRQAAGSTHPESAGLLQEAVDAYNWGEAYISAHPDKVTQNVHNARLAAAFYLYSATGTAGYQATAKQIYENSYNERGFAIWTNPSESMMGRMTHMLLPPDFPGLDTAFQATVTNWITNLANNTEVATMAQSGFRYGMDRARWVGLSVLTTPSAWPSVMAHELFGGQDYTDVVHNQAAYLMGGNQANTVHMTGIGQYRERAVFLPDEWSLMDSDSFVYRRRNWPGYSVYRRNQFDVAGIGSEAWSESTRHPACGGLGDGSWPLGERRTFNRNTIAGSEFTVHQNNGPNVFIYGWLTQPNPAGPFERNVPPTVDLMLEEGRGATVNGPLPLRTLASDDTIRVDYFYGRHFIGSSRDAAGNFPLLWNIPGSDVSPGETITLTAVGYDREGEFSQETEDVDVEVTLTSDPYVAVSGVSLRNLPANPLGTGGVFALEAAVAPADATNRDVVWLVDNPAVGTIDPNGVLSIQGEGSINVTVRTVEGGFEASTSFYTSFVPATGIAITNAPATLSRTNSLQLEAVLSPPNTSENTVRWTSSAPSILSVDDGFITGLATGTATITASIEGTPLSDSATIEVVNVPVSSVTITNVPAEALLRGGTHRLGVEVSPANASDQTISWFTGNGNVATVGSTGLVTGVGVGTTTITARAASGASDTVSVSVDLLRSPALLEHHWPFDNTPEDIVGGLDATLLETTVYTDQSLAGAAAVAGGSNRMHVLLGDLNLPDQFTISLWAWDNGTQQHQNWLLSNRLGNEETSFQLYFNDYNSTNGRVNFTTAGFAGGYRFFTDTGGFPFNRWNHLAITANRATGQATLWVNGSAVPATLNPATVFTNDFYLGTNGDNLWNGFEGRIDEVMVFHRVLDAAEIQSLGTPPPAPQTTWTVTFQTDGTPGATVTGPNPQTVTDGAATDPVTASAPAGYTFVEWSDGAGFQSTSNPLIFSPVTENVTLTAAFADLEAPTSSAAVADATQVGGSITGTYSAEDAGSGLDQVALWRRQPTGAWAFAKFVNGGVWSFNPGAGDGVYLFATVATDLAGNAQAAPSADDPGQVLVHWNDAANSSYAYDSVADGTFVFPMTADLDVEIAFAGGATGGAVTVERQTGDVAPAGYMPGRLIDEALVITGTFTGEAMITWPYDAANGNGLDGALDTVFRFEAGVETGVYTPAVNGSVLTIGPVDGFSTWYAGSNDAVVGEWSLLDEE